MKISTKSWHYRSMEKAGIVDPHNCINLCMYIRGLLLTFIIPIWFIISPFLTYISLQFYLPNARYNPPISEVIGITFMLVGIYGTFIDLVIIYSMVDEFYVNHIQQHLSFLNKPKKEHYPNIFIEYLKAKKQKMCPLVEFEDN